MYGRWFHTWLTWSCLKFEILKNLLNFCDKLSFAKGNLASRILSDLTVCFLKCPYSVKSTKAVEFGVTDSEVMIKISPKCNLTYVCLEFFASKINKYSTSW